MNIIDFLGIVILMCGVILIYDARHFAKNVFSFSDQNGATLGLKILGFIMSFIGGFLIILT